MEMGHRYLQVMMKFFGIHNLEEIIIEGHVQFPEKANEIKDPF
jgi:FMN-dependent NADH-azoreductase